MLPNLYFFTDPANFGKVRELLERDFGLIPPASNLYPRAGESVLLYWQNGQEIYRVIFNSSHKAGPNIRFRWAALPLGEGGGCESLKATVAKVYELLKPVRVTDGCVKELDLEKILQL